jgi:hypothetical protein
MIPYDVHDNKGSLTWLTPTQCYLSNKDETGHLSRLFVFVDFGVTANSFLAVCGAKRLPSVDEIAQKLIEDPGQFLSIAGGHEK